MEGVILMTMGEIIKNNRLRLGLSQEELGEKVGVNKAAVQKWESGAVENIKRNKIKALSKIFGITPTELLGFCDDFKQSPEEKQLSKESKAYDVITNTFGKDASKLINSFVQLNEEGKEKVLDIVSDYAANPKYTL